MIRLFLSAALLLSLGAAKLPDAQSHIDAARKAAGTQWAARVDGFCGIENGPRPERAPRGTLPVTPVEDPDWPEPPAKVFDNLYFVGSKGVSAFAINTPDGIIITDAMWAYDIEKSVVGGLTTLGLDPKKIRYVIIPHGHPDHYGGAQFLHDRYGAKIVAPKGDLEQIARGPTYDTTPIPKGYDLVVEDGSTLTLGGVTVRFHVLPGHTPGGVVMTFPVTDKGRPHRMLIWAAGGATPPSTDGQRSQVPALQRLIAYAKAEGVDALGDNHGSHLLTEKMKASPTAGNPFLVGKEAVLGYLTTRLECNEARIAGGGTKP